MPVVVLDHVWVPGWAQLVLLAVALLSGWAGLRRARRRSVRSRAEQDVADGFTAAAAAVRLAAEPAVDGSARDRDEPSWGL